MGRSHSWGAIRINKSKHTTVCNTYSTVQYVNVQGNSSCGSSVCQGIAVVYCTVAMHAQVEKDAVPWKMMSFQQRPASKRDCWTILPDWVIRVHGSARTQPFHPLHASFPLHGEGGEALSSRRVTVAFLEGHDTPSRFEDSWTTSPSSETRSTWKSRGKWTGYTFFCRKIVDAHATQAGPGSSIDEHHVTSPRVEQDTIQAHPSTSHADVAPRRGYDHGGVAARGKAAFCTMPPQYDEQHDFGFEVVQDGA